MTSKKTPKEREADLEKREMRIIDMERKLYRQQAELIKLMREISRQQLDKRPKSPTIDQVLERFTTKKGKDGEETTRKYNAIVRYITAAGVTLRDKYEKFHNEQTLLRLTAIITNRTDIQGDQKARHVRWIHELVNFATIAYPDLYKTDVLFSQPKI